MWKLRWKTMRAELHCDGNVERIELPESSLYGISVVSPDGRIHIEAVNIENLDSDYLDEADTVLQKIERIMPDGLAVCIFCWSVPELAFISDMMAMYPGMKYIEVHKGTFAVELIC